MRKGIGALVLAVGGVVSSLVAPRLSGCRTCPRGDARPTARKLLTRLPLEFQAEADGRAFVTRGRSYAARVEATGFEVGLAASRPLPGGLDAARGALPPTPTPLAQLAARAQEPARTARVRVRFAGARAGQPARVENPAPGKRSLLVGNDPGQWRQNRTAYGRVTYPGAYPGIDLVYYGAGSRLEHDFRVAPGADPSVIRLELDAPSAPRLDPRGDLVISTPAGELRQLKPVAYQEITGMRVPVPCAYRLARGTEWENGRMGERESGRPRTHTPPFLHSPIPPFVSFEVGHYDKTKPLVIDPQIDFATYLGGAGNDSAQSIVADSQGNYYVLSTSTQVTGFPVTGQIAGAKSGLYDLFVTKLSPEGQILYSVEIGGTGNDYPGRIDVDETGAAFFCSTSNSKDFPTTPGAFQGAPSDSGLHAIVCKLAPDGASLVYSTYLRGKSTDTANALDVDASGRAWVTGSSSSSDFPTTPGAVQAQKPGGQFDGVTYLARLNATGSAVEACSFFGGTGFNQSGEGIRVDPVTGRVALSGTSDAPDMPTTANALQKVKGAATDAFVAVFEPDLSAALYSSYLGGSGLDLGRGVDFNAAGLAVTGIVTSPDFPLRSPIQSQLGGANDAYVAHFAPDFTPVYVTFLGGSGGEYGIGVVIDNSDPARPRDVIVGTTGSPDMPTVRPLQPYGGGPSDAYYTILAMETSSGLVGPRAVTVVMDVSSPIGGSGNESGVGVCQNTLRKAIALAGVTSSSQDFPRKNAAQPNFGGGEGNFPDDGFVVECGGNDPPCKEPTRVRDFKGDLVEDQHGGKHVEFTWKPPADLRGGTLKSYNIYKREVGGQYALVEKLKEDPATHKFPEKYSITPEAGKVIQYIIKAETECGESAASDLVEISTPLGAIVIKNVKVKPNPVKGGKDAKAEGETDKKADKDTKVKVEAKPTGRTRQDYPAGATSDDVSAAAALPISVPSTVTLKKGQTKFSFTIKTKRVTRRQTFKITCTIGSKSKSTTLTVTP